MRSAIFTYKPLVVAISLAVAASAAPSWADADVKNEVVRPEAVVKIDPRLEKLAASQERVPVVVILAEQPQRDIATRINSRYEKQLDSLAAQVRAIYDKYLPKKDFPDEASEVEQSKLLEQYVTDADKKEIRALNEQREALQQTVRKLISSESALAVAQAQEAPAGRIEALGGKIRERFVVSNALAVDLPSSVLKDVASLPFVAEVVYDHPGEAELSNQTQSLGADTWWASGFDGGVWDVGVLDEGVQHTHPALAGHTFYRNYTTASNHGTGVACMYGSSNATHKGLAFGLNAILVDDAGSESTSMAGADWMLRSAGDDPEVINYSWGNGAATGNDWHAFSRFVDAVVSDYNTNWAKSAGNNGAGTNTMTVPANNYNGMTVANMFDNNTISRSDDVIWTSSSRGPTVNNRKKPDLAAPGHQTMTCNGSSGYANLGGTSSAAPKVGAASLLLTDGGNWDPKAIKAVLINTADSWEDNNTDSSADDTAKTGKEWNKTYGWGYLDLRHAHFHRNDYFTSSVKPKGQTGSFKLYKGTMYNGDKATLVWERDVNYKNAATPTQYRDLSDLDLKLYNRTSNAQLDSDTTVRDNVHQVAATASVPSVVKVYAYSSAFDGASSEPFALATEENFSPATGPAFSLPVTAPSSVVRNSTFVVSVALKNTGDLPAHAVATRLNLPAGFTLLSGSQVQTVTRLNEGATQTLSWTVRAPSITRVTALTFSTTSTSYGETFSASASRAITVF
jgi:serine protease AprX